MGLKISGLNELRERLERLRPEEVMARALAEQANRMAARVRDGLSEPAGAAGHNEPWLRSGALRDSVGAQADGLQAAVGSSDPAAVPQELGTAHMPARPFLMPVAAGMGEDVARAVGARVAAALRGDGTDGFDPSGIQLVSGSGEHPEDLGDAPPEDRRAVEEGLESPGQARAHGLPQIIPGLNSPVPTIPRFGGGRSPVSAAPRPAAPSGQQPVPAGSGVQAPGAAAPTRQPPVQAVPSQAPTPAGSSGTRADLINELLSKGTKITPPDVVAAVRMPNGNIAFLERGDSKSGLQHIVERHGAEFAQAGISEGKIPDFLAQALKNGMVVGQQSRRGARPIYEVSYKGRTLRVAITVGSNGYIVGANIR